MCGCPNIKVRYVGEDETHWTTNQVYQVISVSVDGGAPRLVLFSNIDNALRVAPNPPDTDWELVSVSVPTETVLFP